ncbi:hypothetical protein P8C59_000790 [Phyllachora maydis]|uniref:Methylenetetrahydrofolate reductase (NAD(P)H) n=1 Tax=Phyllachora maydis TaxID=1825666 RepID=A0AAD9MBK1_9PEZI|nr:hypothetical protein P8C59_000790 [Phyllachora maydis]
MASNKVECNGQPAITDSQCNGPCGGVGAGSISATRRPQLRRGPSISEFQTECGERRRLLHRYLFTIVHVYPSLCCTYAAKMHIRDVLAEAERTGNPSFSFEYFPPKTAKGMQNLYDRIERMYNLGPKFIDVTWGAGGRIAELTCEMVVQAQTHFGLETCMHLTCTDMSEEKVNDALRKAYNAGCTNILALRGDPPQDKENWTATEDKFQYAKDLVKHIRKTYGDHFDIGVAGYPEGCDDNRDEDLLLDHLKEKVDLGASFIVTQMFYDVDNFLRWVRKVRARGIQAPIVPGIMPITSYASFLRRAHHMQCRIPEEWMAKLEPHQGNDDKQLLVSFAASTDSGH